MGTESSDYRVVIVGGWSPGPLTHLKQVLSAHQIIEPRRLNQYMPPFPGLWCCHPAVLLAIFGFPTTIYWACTINDPLYYVVILLILLLCGWKLFVELIAPFVVKFSIEASIRSVHRDGLEGVDPEKLLIIGFSWGGCIVAEMIARGMVGQPSQPAALLIAPTTAVVARISNQEDAATRIAGMDLANDENQNPARITVVHGALDRTFCPHQIRWRNLAGVDLETLNDNHVFLTPSSLETLEHIANRYVQH